MLVGQTQDLLSSKDRLKNQIQEKEREMNKLRGENEDLTTDLIKAEEAKVKYSSHA